MTKEELKKLLHSYRDIEAERSQILLEVKRLESTIAPKAPNMDGMPRGSGVGDPTGNTAVQRATLIEQYNAQLERLAATQTRIEELIEALEPLERKLMRHRYIEGLTWETVCVVMDYSWRQTHRIHSSILDKLVATSQE